MADDITNTNDDMRIFRRKLMDDLQLVNLSPEQQKEYEEKIDRLVDNRIKALILIYLPQEKVEELHGLWEGGKEEEIQQFLEKNIRQ